jgi:hypothetical protein
MGSESGFFFYDSQLFLCRSVQRLIKGAFQFRYLPRFPQSMQSSQNYRPVCEILVPARGTKQRMDNALSPLSVERKSGNSSQHSTIIVQRPVWSICCHAFGSRSRVGAGGPAAGEDVSRAEKSLLDPCQGESDSCRPPLHSRRRFALRVFGEALAGFTWTSPGLVRGLAAFP